MRTRRIGLAVNEATFAGFLDYKREHGKREWVFPVVLKTYRRYSTGFLGGFELDALVGSAIVSDLDTGRLPFPHFISFTEDDTPLAVCKVLNDNERIGEFAAEHLLGLGLKRFYYVYAFANPQSEGRHLGFSRELLKAGFECERLQAPFSLQTGRGVTTLSADPAEYRQLIRAFRPPAGVFVFNDTTAYALSTACQAANVKVPGDVCIVGVDNDFTFTRASTPELSSVDNNQHGRGYLAAELLDGLLKGIRPERALYRVAPLGVVQRGSTFRLAVDCREVAEALQFIALNAAEQINVADVVRNAAVGRRSLEQKFRRHVGCTILDELRQTRLRIATRLLRETGLNVKTVALRSGFPSADRMQVLFKKTFGLTPGRYRERNRKPRSAP